LQQHVSMALNQVNGVTTETNITDDSSSWTTGQQQTYCISSSCQSRATTFVECQSYIDAEQIEKRQKHLGNTDKRCAMSIESDPSDPDNFETNLNNEEQKKDDRIFDKQLQCNMSLSNKDVDDNHPLTAQSYDINDIRSGDGFPSRKTSASNQVAVNSMTNFSQRMIKKSKRPPTIIHIHGIRKIECFFEKWLWYLGKIISRAPSLGIVFPLIVFVLIMAGLFFNQDKLSKFPLPFEAFHPNEILPKIITEKSETVNQYKTLEQIGLFNFWNSKTCAILIKVKNSAVSTEIKHKIFKFYLKLKHSLNRIELVSGDHVKSYEEFCQDANYECSTAALELASLVTVNVETLKRTTLRLVSLGNKTHSNDYSDVNGFTAVDSQKAFSLNKFYGDLRAILLVFQIPNATSFKDMHRQFENRVQNMVNEFNQNSSNLAHLNFWSKEAYKSAVNSTVTASFNQLSNAFIIVLLSTILLSLKRDEYISRPLFGVAISVGVVLVLLSSFAIDVSSSSQFQPLAISGLFYITAAFLFFNFNILQSWRKFNNVSSHPVEKLRLIMSIEIAPVILILFCCLLSFAAVACCLPLTIFTSYNRIIATSSFYSIVFISLFCSTVLYLSGRMEASGLKWFNFWQKGDTNFTDPVINSYDRREIRLLQSRLLDESRSFSRRIGFFTSNVHVRFVTLLIACIYIIFVSWTCSITNVQLSAEMFMTSASKFSEFWLDYREQFSNLNSQVELVFNEPLNYNSEQIQDSISALLNWTKQSNYVSKHRYWFEELNAKEQISNLSRLKASLAENAKLYFTENDKYAGFQHDIVTDDRKKVILKSRIVFQLNEHGTFYINSFVRQLYSVAAKHNLPIVIYNNLFPFLYHNAYIIPDAAIMLNTTVLIVFFVILLLFAKPAMAIIVVVFQYSILFGTIALANIWEIDFNAPIAALLLAGIFHSTVVATSFCSYYCNLMDVAAAKRIAYAFQSTLHSLFSSTVISLLAFTPLLAVGAPVLFDHLKLFTIHLILCWLHYFLFLPASLLLLTVNIPACNRALKKFCNETNCFCFGCCCPDSEKTNSICYIPTAGKGPKVDSDYVRKFYQLKFSEKSDQTHLANIKKFMKTRKNKHLGKARKSTKSRLVAAIRPDILLKSSSSTYSVHGSRFTDYDFQRSQACKIVQIDENPCDPVVKTPSEDSEQDETSSNAIDGSSTNWVHKSQSQHCSSQRTDYRKDAEPLAEWKRFWMCDNVQYGSGGTPVRLSHSSINPPTFLESSFRRSKFRTPVMNVRPPLCRPFPTQNPYSLNYYVHHQYVKRT
ncbi:Patched domain-containing protein 1, partial [Trichinella papuae]